MVGKGATKAVGAGIQFLCDRLLYRPTSALLKGIPNKTSRASTHGNMIDDLAFSIEATCARAGVHTLVVGAGLVATTVGIEDAFRPTAQLGIAKEAWWTGAGAAAVFSLGNGARTAGTGVADIRPRSWWCNNI